MKTAALLVASASAFAPRPAPPATSALAANAELENLATELNPIVGFFDPIGLSGRDLWDSGEAASIGFLREAEIKHGRIAMAGFVGYVVQANHIEFPWKHLGTGAVDMSSMTPPEQWDAIPEAAKWQIFTLIGFLEIWGEGARKQHYMAGGRPGEFPSFEENFMEGIATRSNGDPMGVPHVAAMPFKSLYDPLGFASKRTPEQKAKGLLAETNNGRLAMLGLFGFVAESKIPGSVPVLTNIGIPEYKGDYMAPFEAHWHLTLFQCDSSVTEAFCGAAGRGSIDVMKAALPFAGH